MLREGDYSTTPHNHRRIDGLKDPWRGFVGGRTGRLSNKGELGEVMGSVCGRQGVHFDFCAQFVEAFSNIMGMDSGADQIHTPVLATFLSALLPILQTQIKEEVAGWQAQTSVQTLAAATQLG